MIDGLIVRGKTWTYIRLLHMFGLFFFLTGLMNWLIEKMLDRLIKSVAAPDHAEPCCQTFIGSQRCLELVKLPVPPPSPPPRTKKKKETLQTYSPCSPDFYRVQMFTSHFLFLLGRIGCGSIKHYFQCFLVGSRWGIVSLIAPCTSPGGWGHLQPAREKHVCLLAPHRTGESGFFKWGRKRGEKSLFVIY